MAIEKQKLSLTKKAIAEFDKKSVETTDLDYGKRFYEHFRLDRVVDQSGISQFKTANKASSKLILKQLFKVL